MCITYCYEQDCYWNIVQRCSCTIVHHTYCYERIVIALNRWDLHCHGRSQAIHMTANPLGMERKFVWNGVTTATFDSIWRFPPQCMTRLFHNQGHHGWPTEGCLWYRVRGQTKRPDWRTKGEPVVRPNLVGSRALWWGDRDTSLNDIVVITLVCCGPVDQLQVETIRPSEAPPGRLQNLLIEQNTWTALCSLCRW